MALAPSRRPCSCLACRRLCCVAQAVSLQADLDCDADALLDVDYELFEDGEDEDVCLCWSGGC